MPAPVADPARKILMAIARRRPGKRSLNIEKAEGDNVDSPMPTAKRASARGMKDAARPQLAVAIDHIAMPIAMMERREYRSTSHPMGSPNTAKKNEKLTP